MEHGIWRTPTKLADRADSVPCFSGSGSSPRGIASNSLGTTSLVRRALLGAEQRRWTSHGPSEQQPSKTD
eukprot:214570-Pyramimonas_sp.AAC.1